MDANRSLLWQVLLKKVMCFHDKNLSVVLSKVLLYILVQ